MGSYYRYYYSMFYTIPSGQTVKYIDQPLLGLWPDAYYLGIRAFDEHNLPLGMTAIALDRHTMLTAGTTAAGYQACDIVLPTTNAITLVPSTLAGSLLLPPSGAPNILASLHEVQGTNSALNFYRFSVNWLNPMNTQLTGPTSVGVTPFYGAFCPDTTFCVEQPAHDGGTPSPRLDNLGNTLSYPLIYRNLGDHDYLLLNHTVRLSSFSDLTGIRWYQFRDVFPAVAQPTQQSTYGGFDAEYRWDWDNVNGLPG